MNGPRGRNMQVIMETFLYSKATMSKPTASGTASVSDKSQIPTISTAVTVGTPVEWTRDQDDTARYLHDT